MDDIKLALLGDHEAAKRLTDAGVLIPCMCGGEADCNCNGLMQGGSFKWAVECLKCGLILGPFETEKEAEAQWNTRAPILSAKEMEMLEGMDHGN